MRRFCFHLWFGFASQSDQLRRPCNLIGCRQGAYGATLARLLPAGACTWRWDRKTMYEIETISVEIDREGSPTIFDTIFDIDAKSIIWTRVIYSWYGHTGYLMTKCIFFSNYDVFNKWEHLLLTMYCNLLHGPKGPPFALNTFSLIANGVKLEKFKVTL